MNKPPASPQNDVMIIKANMALQAKIGAGPLDEKVVERCQQVMENNTVDFAPLAMEYLDNLEAAIQNAKSGALDLKQATEEMTAPVMQLKANASTFKYNLIGNLANIMLSFLEAVKELDNDVIAIVGAHHQTLKAIILKKMSGDGGAVGKTMEEELKGACARYFSKRKA
jgi:hypothetical protein